MTTWLGITFALVVSAPLVLGQINNAEAESDDVFLFKPNTPSRQVRGAIIAERLDRPAIAQGYLQDLIDSQPSNEVLLALRKEFGIGTFLKLSGTRELQPVSRDLLKLVNEATTQVAPSASSVELLIAELGQSKQQTKDAALRILSAENEAVFPLLQADETTTQGKLAAELLSRNSRRFRDGLLNALPDADNSTKTRILHLLGTSADPQLVSDLMVYRFDESGQVAEAADSAIRRLSDSNVTLESAEDTAKRLQTEALELIRIAGTTFPTIDQRLNDRNLQKRYLSDDSSPTFGSASIARALKLMAAANAIAPNDTQGAAGLLMSEMTQQGWMAKWTADIAVKQTNPGPPNKHYELAMELAINSKNPSSTFAMLLNTEQASKALHNSPQLQRSYLLSNDSKTRLLAAAIAAQNGKANALCTLPVQAAASGSSSQPETVVIDSRPSEKSTKVAVLKSLRYSTTGGGSGQQGLEAAVKQMNCELILIHSNCLRWSLSDTVANLRADYRTCNTPIIIYGPGRDERATSHITTHTSGVWFVPEPLSETTLEDYLRIMNVPGPVLATDERKLMSLFARKLNFE